MRHLIRLFHRLAIFGIGCLAIWLIVSVFFKFSDHRTHWIIALAVTYAVAAYVILPIALRMGLKILQHKHVPRYTITGDGLPGDPVNLALIGDFDQIRAAFSAAGWLEADRLSFATAVRMTRAFIFKTAYPTAPFSTLYLFGRGQDIGFQKGIDNNPRKRHHIRFWALCLTQAQATVGSRDFWLNTDRPPESERVLWVGAGTRDTGLGFTRLTFKITHATDSDTNAERDFVLAELTSSQVIDEVKLYQTGDHIGAHPVNHYITDGAVAAANLR